MAELKIVSFQEFLNRQQQQGTDRRLDFLIEFVGTDDNLMLDLHLLMDRYARLTPEMVDRLDAREIRGHRPGGPPGTGRQAGRGRSGAVLGRSGYQYRQCHRRR